MERIVVICGAGVGESCNLHSTSDVTRIITSSGSLVRRDVQYRSRPVNIPSEWQHDEEVIPVTRLLWSALRGQYSDPNFETYIHALETLIPIAVSRIDPGYGHDEYRPITMAYAEILSRYDGLLRTGVLQKERAETIKKIFSALGDSYRRIDPKAKDALLGFLKMVNEQSDARFINLNYDDLLDELIGSEGDGFVNEVEGSGARAFDARSFMDLGIARGTAIHLHGSVRFGYGPSLHGEPAPILKFADRATALESIDTAIRSNDMFRGDRIEAGVLRASAPMISGYQKADKVMLTPSPFGYYYHATVAELLRSARFLVLGYSGSDPHINTWLYESARLHGSAFRMAFVTKSSTFSTVVATREMQFIFGVTGQSAPSSTSANVTYIGENVAGTGVGLPLDDDTQEKLLRFILA